MKKGIQAQYLAAETERYASKVDCIKSISDVGILRRAKEINPGIWTQYRHYIGDQQAALERGGKAVAQEVLNELGGFQPDALEPMNECFQFGWENLEAYLKWQTEYFAYLRPFLPRTLFVLNENSVGCPEKDDWRLVVKYKFCGADLIGVHQYWAWDYMEPWTAMRHRIVHQWLVEFGAADHPPFSIDECGCDAVYGAPGGWKAQGKTAERYRDELRAVFKEWEADRNVFSCYIFVSGPYNWPNFEIDSIVDVLLPLWDEEGDEVIPFREAFAALANKHKPKLGYPLEEIQYDFHGNARQTTNTGVAYSFKFTDSQGRESWRTFFHEQASGAELWL